MFPADPQGKLSFLSHTVPAQTSARNCGQRAGPRVWWAWSGSPYPTARTTMLIAAVREGEADGRGETHSRPAALSQRTQATLGDTARFICLSGPSHSFCRASGWLLPNCPPLHLGSQIQPTMGGCAAFRPAKWVSEQLAGEHHSRTKSAVVH